MVNPVSEDTAWQRRAGTEFNGLLIPFGAKIAYRPAGAARTSKLKFEERTSEGIFLGWHVNPGPRYSGDHLVLDLDAYLQNPSGAMPRRVKEVYDTFDRVFHCGRQKTE